VGRTNRPRLPLAASSAALVLLALAAAACGSSGPTIDPAAPTGRVESAAINGRFQLTFAVDRGVVRAEDEITGQAALSLTVPGGATISGSGALFLFDFREIGGAGRHVAPVSDLSCAPHRVTSDTPSISPIVKTGAVIGPADPNAAFITEFLKGTAVHLPRGTWDITATASFHDAEACAGRELVLSATVRVHVSE
jgi:hypothetical protein